MDEFELIQKYFVRQGSSGSVVTGIGDDGAVLQPDDGQELVTVIDTLVAGVHFPIETDARDVGYRSVAVNLSDIAAMGARPRWMTLALTMPAADEQWIERFAEGLHAAAAEWDVQLVGGDMTRGDTLVASVQITGDVAAGRAIHRSGAGVGDTVFVTGTIGDAAAGLKLLSERRPNDYLSSRFLRPSARIGIGMALTETATAAIDVSDGLVADLGKLLQASDVGAEIDLELLPLSAELRQCFDRDNVLRFAMTGGDDYELCFTSSEASISSSEEIPVTAIGRITETGELICRDGDLYVHFDGRGYRHFQ